MPSTVKSKIDDAALVAKRRSQILGAAIELFGKRGYHATTIRQIADRAGVSTGLVYQYFGDKEDVLFLALQTVLDSYKERIPQAAEGLRDPLQRLRAAVHAYCRVIDANIDATVLAYRETKSVSRARRNLIKQKEIETNALIEAHVRDCVKAGLLENVDAELLTYQIVMFAHAWALKAWHFRGQMTVDQYVDRNLALLLNPQLTELGRRENMRLADAAAR
ncbi:MAG: transcriptional regulator [Betaproteobacteria bacterium RIFCSPLOWO2_12_FULL_66_14]|nr:MAG: transcriptional regulator [Betaproteobacteria bacterium RIFCSPLOWO2_12_FULL_66_14]